MPEFTIHIPNDKVEMVGRAYGVIQGAEDDPNETAVQAWNRLKSALLWALKRPVLQMRKRELEADNAAADANTSITEA